MSSQRKNIEDIENEKYRLIEKLKNLEIEKNNIESESKRKDDKLKEALEKLSICQSKVLSTREKTKLEQKAVCNLYKAFGLVLHRVNSYNQRVVEYITKIFHSLAIQRELDITGFELFDVRQQMEELFSEDMTSNFKKVDWTKLKDLVLSGLKEISTFKESSKFFEVTYKSLLKRMDSCTQSNAELVNLCSKFECTKNLMKENNALLRSSTFKAPNNDPNRSSMNLDDSSVFRAARLDESSFVGGNESFRQTNETQGDRSHRNNQRRSSMLNEDSVVMDFENADFLEEKTPMKSRTRSSMQFTTGMRFQDDHKNAFFIAADEEATLNMNLFCSNLINTKLEDKIADLQESIGNKKKELQSMTEERTELEKQLEESFYELDGRTGVIQNLSPSARTWRTT